MKIFYHLILTIFFICNLNAHNNDFTDEEKYFLKSQIVKIGLHNDLPPFGFIQNGKITGYSYDVIELISKKSGLKFNFHPDSWSNNLKKFKNRQIDIIDSISFLKNRVPFTNYTQPYYEIPLGFISSNNMKNIYDINDLKGKKIGITENIFYEKEIEELNLFKIYRYKNLTQKLRALAHGEIDLVIDTLISAQISIVKSGYTNLKIQENLTLPITKNEDLRLGVNKNNLILYSIIQKSLHTITKKEWDDLNNKWINKYSTREISLVDESIKLTNEEKNYLNFKKTIKVQNETNWPPYNFIENGQAKGFSIDYTNLLAQKLGLNVEYVSGYTWNEFLQMLKNGEIDVINNISKNKEREEYISFTNVFHTAANAIYVKSGSEYIDSLEKLNGKTIVMPKGFFAQQLLEKHYPQINQIHVKDSLEALKVLSLGKADATIGKKNVLDYIISTKNISGVVPTNFVNDNRIISLIRMGVSKEETLLRDLLQKSIDSVSDEQLLNLKRKWFGTPSSVIEEPRHFLNTKEKNYLFNKNIITMCNFKDLKPIEFIDEFGDVQGLSIDTLKLIENELNVKFEHIKTVSNEQSIEFFENKKCKILPAVKFGEILSNFTNLTKPYLSYKLAIITQHDKPIVSSIEELIDKKMSIKKDSLITQHLKSNYPDINIFETNNDLQALKSVSNGSSYYTVAPLPVASYYMSKYALNDLFISRYTNILYTVNIAVNEDDKILLDILNKTLDHITEDKKRDVFLKWSSFSVKEKFDSSIVWKVSLVVVLILVIIFYRQSILNRHNTQLTKANKEIEEKTIQLAKQKEIYKKLFTKSSDGVIVAKDKRIIDCNESALKLFGYESKKEFLQKTVEDISSEFQNDNKNSLEEIEKIDEEILISGNKPFEWLFKRKNNSLFWADVVSTLIEIDGEKVFHAIVRDISKKKEIEDELANLTKNLEVKVKEEISKNQMKTNKLIQQSRLAQMGELISMIAHQWRQPLTSISATANNLLLQILLDKKLSPEVLEKEITLIADYSQHLSDTIDDFRNFYKTNNTKTEVTIEEIVDRALKILGTSIIDKGIKITTNYNCFEKFNTYSSELTQVILNLLKNAEDVLVENSDIEIPEIIINTLFLKDYITVEVIDNAGGIKPKYISKLFDPYFSTKLSKDGSGLGLYMSKKIIEEHCNGQLSVKNSKNGAIFTIKLKKG